MNSFQYMFEIMSDEELKKITLLYENAINNFVNFATVDSMMGLNAAIKLCKDGSTVNIPVELALVPLEIIFAITMKEKMEQELFRRDMENANSE